MKKTPKVISIILALSMLATFTACGNNSPAAEENANSDNTSSTQVPEAGTEDVQDPSTESGEKNLYGFDEPITLKVGYAWPADFEWLNGETSTDNVWLDLYQEHNIIPEILYEVDASQGETKLSTAIMSGNYPDIMSIASNKLSDYANFAATGVVADITDVFEEYASDELKAYVNADGGLVMDSLMINDRLYGLPRLSNAYDSVSLMFIRQDWLDHLGLDMPTTMEELKEVAYAFTYDDPDGNGADAEGMKSGLTFLQELYTEGSLAKDFITMDSNKVFEEAGAGRCGIWFGPMWASMQPSTDLLDAGFTASHITAAAIPDGLDQGGSRALLKSTPQSVFVVSSQC